MKIKAFSNHSPCWTTLCATNTIIAWSTFSTFLALRRPDFHLNTHTHTQAHTHTHTHARAHTRTHTHAERKRATAKTFSAIDKIVLTRRRHCRVTFLCNYLSFFFFPPFLREYQHKTMHGILHIVLCTLSLEESNRFMISLVSSIFPGNIWQVGRVAFGTSYAICLKSRTFRYRRKITRRLTQSK